MKLAAGVAMAVALSGCVQATRHSNAIVFGTNTSLGVTVGPNATSVPAISIGYNRQEAVFLPLLANTREAAEIVTRDDRQLGALQPSLSPCNIDPTHVARVATGQGGRDQYQPLSAAEISQFATSSSANPCLFVARRQNRDGTEKTSDSYSVFASFGGRVSGGQGTNPNAALGVAQYFATGVAAQIIAENGGAAISAAATSPPAAATPTPAQAGDTEANSVRSDRALPDIPEVPELPAVPAISDQ